MTPAEARAESARHRQKALIHEARRNLITRVMVDQWGLAATIEGLINFNEEHPRKVQRIMIGAGYDPIDVEMIIFMMGYGSDDGRQEVPPE